MQNDSQTTPGKAKLKRKEYEKELHKLQIELCKLQEISEAPRAAHYCHFRGPRWSKLTTFFRAAKLILKFTDLIHFFTPNSADYPFLRFTLDMHGSV
jgi:hypothetical protein